MTPHGESSCMKLQADAQKFPFFLFAPTVVTSPNLADALAAHSSLVQTYCQLIGLVRSGGEAGVEDQWTGVSQEINLECL